MKKIIVSLTIIGLVAFISCKEKKTETEQVVEEVVQEVEKTSPKIVSFILESKNESSATGKVEFEEVNGIVNLEIYLRGLTPGIHAIHIHEKADCSSPDGKSAGGHWNPTMEKHGKWGDTEGFHKGDIGNIVADENGEGRISMQTDQWCIGCGDEKKDILGKAIIVHDGEDDFITQPTGNAGGRVSCGGIIE
jgi:Cu-Zn family superoxide dismutase